MDGRACSGKALLGAAVSFTSLCCNSSCCLSELPFFPSLCWNKTAGHVTTLLLSTEWLKGTQAPAKSSLIRIKSGGGLKYFCASHSEVVGVNLVCVELLWTGGKRLL